MHNDLISPENMVFMFREAYNLQGFYCDMDCADKVRPSDSQLFTPGQFLSGQQTVDLLTRLNESEIVLVTDRLYISWFLTRSASYYFLFGPFHMLPVSTSMLTDALADTGLKQSSAAAYREYLSLLPSMDGNQIKSFLNLFLHFSGGEDHGLRWLDLYNQKEELFSDSNKYNTYARKAYHLEADYMENMFLGNTRGAMDALTLILRRFNSRTAGKINELTFSVYGNAVCCTMARIAAYQAGVQPLILDEIFRNYQSLAVNARSVKEQFHQLYAMTALVCEKVQLCRTAEYSPLVRKTVCYLLEHYPHEICQKDVAQVMGVAPSYLSAAFTRETGYGFTRFLNRIRLRKASMQLRYSDESIGRIAASVGIPDQNYFSRLFQQEYHTTPSAWRQISDRVQSP